MSSAIEERNKANVVAFYELMFNDCRPAEAIRNPIIGHSTTRRGWGGES